VLGALANSQADVAASISGIAGPSGGTPDKPVGTVCFAWARKNGPLIKVTQQFEGDRQEVRKQAAMYSILGLLEQLS
jgi:nicotinamide-nucleotide amidase